MFYLQTNASKTGISGELSQKVKMDTTAQSHISADDCWIGKHIVEETDHRSLQYLHKWRDENGRIMRWSLLLQPFKFTVLHRPGINNVNADGLSRQSEVVEHELKEGGMLGSSPTLCTMQAL